MSTPYCVAGMIDGYHTRSYNGTVTDTWIGARAPAGDRPGAASLEDWA